MITDMINVFKRIITFVAFLFLSIFFAFSQKVDFSYFKISEDSLVNFTTEMNNTNNDSIKYFFANKISAVFQNVLAKEKSFDYPFDSLKKISVLKAPDNMFKIITWNIAKNNGDNDFIGFLQVFNKKTKKYMLYKLYNKTNELQSPEKQTIDNNRWIGCIYYNIILKSYKGNNYYTLIGWDGNNSLSNKKIIDVITFNSSGKPIWGAPIFQSRFNPKVLTNRVIFEYAKNAVMKLNYDEKLQKIIFDHLSPLESYLEGQYQFYGPDLSYDAYFFKNGIWKYLHDIDIRNDKKFDKEIKRKPQIGLSKPNNKK
jgi:hypothetical protein